MNKGYLRFFIHVIAVSIVIGFTTVETKAQNSLQRIHIKDSILVKGISVYGKPVDNQTRCVHWHSLLDIIAIKFNCCNKYYPCYSCHKETAAHEATVWPKQEFDQKAILCGACGHELTINEYMNCQNTCPKCASLFNPGCKNHYHLYFETGIK